MDEQPFVSIIMPIRNEEDYIENSIKSILENDYPKDKIEIIVVDGMSDDETRNIVNSLAKEHDKIRLLDNPRKVVPTAMNIGISEVKGDLFIRIDGHAEIYPDYITNSVNSLRQHPEAWVVGGFIENISESFIGKSIAVAMQSPIAVGNSRFRLGNFEGYVDTLAFGTHHKWVIDKIGTFDEELVRNQDDEFNARIINAGGKIWMSKDIRSKYYSRGSLKKLWRQYFQYGFWRIRTIQKLKKPATIRQVIPLAFVFSFLSLIVASIIFRPLVYLLLAEIILYLFGLALGAVHVGLKSGFLYGLMSPVIFIILHFAYGLGGIWGIFRFVLLRGKGMPKPEDQKLSR